MPAGLTDVVAIAAGGHGSLALQANGTVVAWGSQSYLPMWVPPNDSDVVAIGISSDHRLALLGDGSLRVTLDPPIGRSAFYGRSTRFHATATGTLPLSYQWQHNDSVLPGATRSLLNLADLQPDDDGVYSVVVTDGLGRTASAEAQLDGVTRGR